MGHLARDLRLNYATLSWTAGDGSIHLINLDDPKASGQRATLGRPYSIDADQLSGTTPTGMVRVRPPPFAVGTQPPGLIWSKSPDRVAEGHLWKPRFEISRLLKQVQLSLNGGLASTQRFASGSVRQT